MNRRRLLTLCGCSLAGAGGCLSYNPSNSQSNSSRPTTQARSSTDNQTDTSPKETISIERISVRKSKIDDPLGFRSSSVVTNPNKQHVTVQYRVKPSVTEEADKLSDKFVFVTDQQLWEPEYSNDDFQDPDEGRLVTFTIPSPLSASNPRIQYPPADLKWALPAEKQAALAASEPHFELEKLEAPTTITPGDPLPVSVTVTNTSDVDGRFLAGVHWPTQVTDDDETTIIEHEVSASSTFTESLNVNKWGPPYKADTVTLEINGHISAERTIDIQRKSTSS